MPVGSQPIRSHGSSQYRDVYSPSVVRGRMRGTRGRVAHLALRNIIVLRTRQPRAKVSDTPGAQLCSFCVCLCVDNRRRCRGRSLLHLDPHGWKRSRSQRQAKGSKAVDEGAPNSKRKGCQGTGLLSTCVQIACYVRGECHSEHHATRHEAGFQYSAI